MRRIQLVDQLHVQNTAEELITAALTELNDLAVKDERRLGKALGLNRRRPEQAQRCEQRNQ